MSDNPLKETIPSKLSEFLQEQFAKNADIKRAALFGSRARGDHSEQSDFDVAVFGSVQKADKDRLRYALEWEAPTLHKIDLIFYDDCHDEAFKQNILREGITIYDQKGK